MVEAITRSVCELLEFIICLFVLTQGSQPGGRLWTGTWWWVTAKVGCFVWIHSLARRQAVLLCKLAWMSWLWLWLFVVLLMVQGAASPGTIETFSWRHQGEEGERTADSNKPSCDVTGTQVNPRSLEAHYIYFTVITYMLCLHCWQNPHNNCPCH